MNRNLLITGLSHRSAPVEMRERLGVLDVDREGALSTLQDGEVIDEVAIISTCNRVEVVCAGNDADRMQVRLHQSLEQLAGVNAHWMQRYTRSFRDEEAIRHLFRVSSSLDSLVIGEPQILGQVKEAFATWKSLGGTSTLLNRTFSHAFRTAKRVRNETQIAENAVSVSYAAVELARKVFGELKGRRVLVVGAGKMGSLAAVHLREAGAKRIDIVNRSLERARELATQLDAAAYSFEELDGRMAEADIVITSTGSQNYIINRDRLKGVMARRKYRPLFLVDIAVPRDIDPRCDQLGNVYLFDVDDLERVVEANKEARLVEAERAEQIVGHEVLEHQRWIASAEAVPTIVSLRQKLTELKDAEVERLLRSNQKLDPEALAAAEKLATQLVNKILHEPTISLREAAADDSPQLVRAARRLFKLDEEDATAALPPTKPRKA